jgi:hypothetical protein
MNGIAELGHRGMGRSILTLKRIYSQPAKSLAPRSLQTGVASSRAFVCRALEGPKPWQGVYVFRESLGRNVANPPSCCPITDAHQEADARGQVHGLAVMSSL